MSTGFKLFVGSDVLIVRNFQNIPDDTERRFYLIGYQLEVFGITLMSNSKLQSDPSNERKCRRAVTIQPRRNSKYFPNGGKLRLGNSLVHVVVNFYHC